jgi:hypothetical protein
MQADDVGSSSALSTTPASDDNLPDSVIISMLRRETLLTRAKLHVLLFEHLQQDRQLRTWRMQLKQVGTSAAQGQQAWALAYLLHHSKPPGLHAFSQSMATHHCGLVPTCHTVPWSTALPRVFALSPHPQGEPEFERLKRELEEVKHSHRGLDGTYRSQVGSTTFVLRAVI